MTDPSNFCLVTEIFRYVGEYAAQFKIYLYLDEMNTVCLEGVPEPSCLYMLWLLNRQ